MTPDFTLLLVGGMVSAVAVLGFVGWRFGGPDTLAFSIVSGGFTAVMDFLSAFVMRNYETLASLRFGFSPISFSVGSACAGSVCSSPKASWPDHIKTCSPNPGYGGRCRLPPVPSP